MIDVGVDNHTDRVASLGGELTVFRGQYGERDGDGHVESVRSVLRGFVRLQIYFRRQKTSRSPTPRMETRLRPTIGWTCKRLGRAAGNDVPEKGMFHDSIWREVGGLKEPYRYTAVYVVQSLTMTKRVALYARVSTNDKGQAVDDPTRPRHRTSLRRRHLHR
jgi:hypothetical protein